MPRMPDMRAGVAALALVIAGCGGAAVNTTAPADPLRPAALAFAADAERALDGTRLEGVTDADLADAIVDLCTTDTTIGEEIESLGAVTAEAGDIEIAREVLREAMTQVCPTRTGDAAAIDAFLASARGAIASSEVDLTFDDDPLLTAGTSVCATLDAGLGPGEAILVAAAALYGVEASTLPDLNTLIGGTEGIALGAVLGSAAAFLCPEHQVEVSQFVAGL